MTASEGTGRVVLDLLESVQSLDGEGVGYLTTEQIAGSLAFSDADVAGALAGLHAAGLVTRRGESFAMIDGRMTATVVSWHLAHRHQLTLF